jgi:Lipase (class 3)
MSDSMLKVMMKFPRKDFDPNLSLELIHLIDRAAEYYDAYRKVAESKDVDSELPPYHSSIVENVESSLIWLRPKDRELISSNSYKVTSQNIKENEHLVIPAGENECSYLIKEKFLIKIKEKSSGESKNTFFGFILEPKDNNTITYIVFRGTREKIEWINNANFSQTDEKVSDGFREIYTYTEENIRSIQSILTDVLKDKLFKVPDAKIILTGHSLGGALASLAADTIGQLYEYSSQKTLYLYTFASPRVGNTAFKKMVEEKCYKCYRMFNTEDLVPQLPFLCVDLNGGEMSDSKNVRMPAISDCKVIVKTEDVQVTIEDLNYKDIDSIVAIHESSNKNDMPFTQMMWQVFWSIFKILCTPQKEEYVHIGTPICFTRNENAISSNHNLFYTYRNALIEEFLEEE